MPLLVIVTGAPGSGKTTLARRIAQELTLPLLVKDDIKELLFDYLGSRDREWSKKLGHATVELLYHMIGVQLAAGQSMIVECNFDNELATPRLRALQTRYAVEPFQIFCTADQTILAQRFRARWDTGTRHPGHSDAEINAEEFAAILKRYEQPIDLGGKVVTIDTTDFALIDYTGLMGKLTQTLSSTEARST